MSASAALPEPVPHAHDVRIRRLRDGDTTTVEAVFAQLSATSAYLRFGTGMTRLAPRVAAGLAKVEAGHQQVFVAEYDGWPVGLGRWVRGTPDEQASVVEVALEVADAWQGRGIGRRMLEEVAQDAATAGISTLFAYVDPGNARMTGWLRRLGASNPTVSGGPFGVPVATLVPEDPSVGCGCMTECSSAFSARSGSGTASTRPWPREVTVPATSSPSSSPAAADRSGPTSSSTWCGVRPPFR